MFVFVLGRSLELAIEREKSALENGAFQHDFCPSDEDDNPWGWRGVSIAGPGNIEDDESTDDSDSDNVCNDGVAHVGSDGHAHGAVKVVAEGNSEGREN